MFTSLRIPATSLTEGKFLYKYSCLLGGPLLFVVVYYFNFFSVSISVNTVVAVTAWILLWWITEAVPIAVTSLLPLILFPSLGILDLNTTALNYASPTIFLYMSGFIFALAMEKQKLHVRIALYVLKIVGSSYDRIVLGFMISTFFISMWVNNTATTLLMLPIALSVLKLTEEDFIYYNKPEEYRRFSVSILLTIAACSNIGGMATIIGTPTNAVLIGFMKQVHQTDISFVHWFIVGFPLSILMLIACYFIFTKLLFKINIQTTPNTVKALEDRIAQLGIMTYQEYAITVIFALTAMGWIFRVLIVDFTGWSFLNDTYIGLMGALMLFLIPDPLSKTGFLFEWESMSKLSWGILFLLGGGVALAKAFEECGLVKIIGEGVLSSDIHQPFSLVILLISIILLLKPFIGNTALATLALPMALGIASSSGIMPIALGAPVVFACSFAFMLPMACAPNAVVFTTGQVKVKDMVVSGVILTLVGSLLLVLMSAFDFFSLMI